MLPIVGLARVFNLLAPTMVVLGNPQLSLYYKMIWGTVGAVLIVIDPGLREMLATLHSSLGGYLPALVLGAVIVLCTSAACARAQQWSEEQCVKNALKTLTAPHHGGCTK
jgi:hypothetical protein